MKRKSWIIVALVLVVVAVLGYNYLYQDHRDIQQETAVFKGTASELKTLLTGSEDTLSNTTVELRGYVTALELDGLVLSNSVYCKLDSIPEVSLQENLIIKGRVLGYDSLFELVSMDQCKIIND
ncbi:hypothetical protein [Gilvibacter sp. SZ-19]|uniref:hypothetical protein n=1 Tax=unclassified Gilvibacter TaxID=2625242 RepID=UPI000B3C5F9A|nr:hypothetical protein [Gilvibacter sp. SZ-19]ARV10942.1 hypothetical protein BTO09_00675 [Gilvibacter sp. SZ-19]